MLPTSNNQSYSWQDTCRVQLNVLEISTSLIDQLQLRIIAGLATCTNFLSNYVALTSFCGKNKCVVMKNHKSAHVYVQCFSLSFQA